MSFRQAALKLIPVLLALASGCSRTDNRPSEIVITGLVAHCGSDESRAIKRVDQRPSNEGLDVIDDAVVVLSSAKVGEHVVQTDADGYFTVRTTSLEGESGDSITITAPLHFGFEIDGLKVGPGLLPLKWGQNYVFVELPVSSACLRRKKEADAER